MRFFTFLCLMLSYLQSPTASADTIRLAVGLSKPPYVEAGGNSGLEAELAIATLKLAGYTPLIVQVPQTRGLAMLGSAQVDAMLSLLPGALDGVYYSQPLLLYHNRAIVLQRSGIVLHQLADLSRYRIAAFQSARLLLGNNYRQAVDKAPNYTEYADQDSQNKMLYNQRVDIVIGDEMVFHANPTQRDLNNKREAVISYNLFPRSPRHLAFRHRQQCQDFNRALQRLKSSGEYQRITQRYRDKYQLPSD